MFPPVLNKKDFVRRYSLGEFGNKSPTWDNFESWMENMPSSGLFHLRNRVAGGSTHYNLTAYAATLLWLAQENRSLWYLSEMSPHYLNLIQGEVYQSEYGLRLFYSTVKNLPMRDALRVDGREIYGIMAIRILKHYLCPNSYEWLQVLLDRYSGHIVEFSCFDTYWGTLPNYNTVFWEVRGGY